MKELDEGEHAMGHTLASFAERGDAEAFRDEHGGRLVAFEEIDLDLLGRLGRGELGGTMARQERAQCPLSEAVLPPAERKTAPPPRASLGRVPV